MRRRRRPRADHGLWRARAPLAVQVYAAARSGRLVMLDGAAPAVPVGFAVIDAPLLRRREVVGGRVADLIDTHWQHLVFVLLGAVALVGAVVVAVTWPRLGLPAFVVTLGFVLLVLTAGLVGSVLDLRRDVQLLAVPDATQPPRVLAESWSVTLLHGGGDPSAVLAAARDLIAATATSLPLSTGQPGPDQIAVDLAAVTSQADELAVTGHPDLLGVVAGRGRVAVLGSGRLELYAPARVVTPAGIGWVLGGGLAAVALLAFIVRVAERGRCSPAGCPPLADYPHALVWLLRHLVWIGDIPALAPASLTGSVYAVLVRLLGVVLIASAGVASWRLREGLRRQSAGVDARLNQAAAARFPTIGILTSNALEFEAVRALFDEERPGRHPTELLGVLPARGGGVHWVVLVQQHEAGTERAAVIVTNLLQRHPGMRHVVMSGIACGVPRPDDPDQHVGLGDIVVPAWGLCAYDHVDVGPDGDRLRSLSTQPSRRLLEGHNHLARAASTGEQPWRQWLRLPAVYGTRFERPDPATDPHAGVRGSGSIAGSPSVPRVHVGRVASANRSLRNADFRNRVARQREVIAFEMEGVGLDVATHDRELSWFMVRGISDYGDREATGQWRGYAALVAAAYLRAVLAEVPQLQPDMGRFAADQNTP